MKKKPMKKKLLFLLVFCVALSGLMLAKYVKSRDDSDIGEYLDFNYSISRVYRRSSGAGYFPKMRVFTAYRKYNNYLNNLSGQSFPWQGLVDSRDTDHLRKPKDFFNDNVLVVVELKEPSGSIRHEVNSIDKKGNITITRLLPEIGTQDIAYWFITLEMSKDIIPKKFSLEIIDNRYGR